MREPPAVLCARVALTIWSTSGFLCVRAAGCSRKFEFPAAQFNADYGSPLGVCSETAPGSGIFVREFTRSTVQMDCSSWTPTITFK